MNDPISRQEAIKVVSDLLKGIFVKNEDIARKAIEKLPSESCDGCKFGDALGYGECEEPKIWHWIHHEGIDDRYEDIVCPVCHKSFTVDAKRTMDIGFIADDFEFCPHCGEDMRGKQDEQMGRLG